MSTSTQSVETVISLSQLRQQLADFAAKWRAVRVEFQGRIPISELPADGSWLPEGLDDPNLPGFDEALRQVRDRISELIYDVLVPWSARVVQRYGGPAVQTDIDPPDPSGLTLDSSGAGAVFDMTGVARLDQAGVRIIGWSAADASPGLFQRQEDFRGRYWWWARALIQILPDLGLVRCHSDLPEVLTQGLESLEQNAERTKIPEMSGMLNGWHLDPPEETSLFKFQLQGTHTRERLANSMEITRHTLKSYNRDGQMMYVQTVPKKKRVQAWFRDSVTRDRAHAWLEANPEAKPHRRRSAAAAKRQKAKGSANKRK